MDAPLYRWSCGELYDGLCSSVLKFISLGETIPGAAKSIIRSMTFDPLGLAHTCCHHLKKNGLFVIEDREEEEIQEIREEEQTFLEEFESLVEEFNLKFDCLGLSILDFLREHWHPRIMNL
jgi:hypothetical protein